MVLLTVKCKLQLSLLDVFIYNLHIALPLTFFGLVGTRCIAYKCCSLRLRNVDINLLYYNQKKLQN